MGRAKKELDKGGSRRRAKLAWWSSFQSWCLAYEITMQKKHTHISDASGEFYTEESTILSTLSVLLQLRLRVFGFFSSGLGRRRLLIDFNYAIAKSPSLKSSAMTPPVFLYRVPGIGNGMGVSSPQLLSYAPMFFCRSVVLHCWRSSNNRLPSHPSHPGHGHIIMIIVRERQGRGNPRLHRPTVAKCWLWLQKQCKKKCLKSKVDTFIDDCNGIFYLIIFFSVFIFFLVFKAYR